MLEVVRTSRVPFREVYGKYYNYHHYLIPLDGNCMLPPRTAMLPYVTINGILA